MGILANNDGKILRSNQTGKILKQNYNFGKGFNTQNSHWIEIPSFVGIQINSDWSFGIWAQNIADGEDIGQFIGYSVEEYENDGLYVRQSGSVIDIFRNISEVERNRFIDAWSRDKNVIGNIFLKENKSYAGYKKSFNNVLDLYGGTCDQFVIGRTPEKFANLIANNTGIFNYVTVFNRSISDNEILFMNNNLLGNEPLNLLGNILYLKLNKAEIFDFGGDIGEAVGVRDYSGSDNHGRIMDLPSGTLQEQLDYANENLFVTW